MPPTNSGEMSCGERLSRPRHSHFFSVDDCLSSAVDHNLSTNNYQNSAPGIIRLICSRLETSNLIAWVLLNSYHLITFEIQQSANQENEKSRATNGYLLNNYTCNKGPNFPGQWKPIFKTGHLTLLEYLILNLECRKTWNLPAITFPIALNVIK